MRVQLTSLAAAVLLSALPGCSQPQQQSDPAQTEASASVRSRGVVFAITREYNAITIQHEPIPEYGMGAMVMEFTVDEASKLDGLEVGDQVAFELSGPLDIETISVVASQ